jgi:hypothetical protein
MCLMMGSLTISQCRITAITRRHCWLGGRNWQLEIWQFWPLRFAYFYSRQAKQNKFTDAQRSGYVSHITWHRTSNFAIASCNACHVSYVYCFQKSFNPPKRFHLFNLLTSLVLTTSWTFRTMWIRPSLKDFGPKLEPSEDEIQLRRKFVWTYAEIPDNVASIATECFGWCPSLSRAFLFNFKYEFITSNSLCWHRNLSAIKIQAFALWKDLEAGFDTLRMCFSQISVWPK